MTPSNPDNSQPLIYRIADALGVFHLVAPVNHTHAQSEVEGLADALAAKANASDVQTALEGKQNTLIFDTTPTANSTNPVTSGGVKAALDGKAPAGDTEVIFEEGENIFVYLPNYFTNGERQRSFILNYQGEAAELVDLFGGNTNDSIRILSHDDSIITVTECYIAVRVIKQSGVGAQGDTYYIIFDGKNEY